MSVPHGWRSYFGVLPEIRTEGGLDALGWAWHQLDDAERLAWHAGQREGPEVLPEQRTLFPLDAHLRNRERDAGRRNA